MAASGTELSAKHPGNSVLNLLVWVVYFCFGLCLAYTLFYLAGHVGLSYLVLSNRGMVTQSFAASVFSPLLDTWVWSTVILVTSVWFLYRLNRGMISLIQIISSSLLFGSLGGVVLVLFGFISTIFLVPISGLILFFCFGLSRVVFGADWINSLVRVVFGGVIFGLFVEFVAFTLFAIPPVFNLNVGEVGLHWGSVEMSFANLVYPLLPYAYLFLVLIGIAAFIIEALPQSWISKGFVSFKLRNYGLRLSGLFDVSSSDGFGFLRQRWLLFAFLVGAVVSFLFVYFTVLPWANPTDMLVSADAPGYYNWLTQMRSGDFGYALNLAFGNDRCLFLLVSYFFTFLTSTVNVVQFAPAFLILAFGILCFFVLRMVCKVRLVWFLGLLIVPFTFQALGLIYAGYLANMLALIFVLVYIVVFFRLIKQWSTLGSIVALFASVAILFSHSWTWYIFAVSLFTFLLLEWRVVAGKPQEVSDQFRFSVVFAAVTVGLGLLCNFVWDSVSPVSTLNVVLDTAKSGFGLPSLSYLVSGVSDTVFTVLGGVYTLSLLLVLSLIGFVVLVRFNSSVSRFFVAMMFVCCASVVVAGSDFVFDRFLFLMPWGILSSLGLFAVLRAIRFQFASHGKKALIPVWLTVFFVFTLLLNFSLHYIFNINIW